MARGKHYQRYLALAAACTALSSLFTGQQNLAGLTRNINFTENQKDESQGQNRQGQEEDLHYKCPQKGYVYMHDRLVDAIESKTNNTSNSRLIPKKIHFIVQSRCIPQELATQLQQKWQPAETSTKSGFMDDHSILFHDANDIDQNFMSKTAAELGFEFIQATTYASISKLYHCQTDPRVKLDIARFLILWDQGGVAMDLDQLPSLAFLNYKSTNGNAGVGAEEANSTTSMASSIIADTDECVFEVNGDDKSLIANPRFIACAPKHPALYVGILRFLTAANILGRCDHDLCRYDSNDGLQRKMYLQDLLLLHRTDTANTTNVTNANIKTYSIEVDGFLKSRVTQIHSDRMSNSSSNDHVGTSGREFFVKLNLTNAAKEAITLKNLSPSQYKEQCQELDVFENDSFEVNLNSLLKVAGDIVFDTNSTSTNSTVLASSPHGSPKCNNPLVYIPSRYVHGSIGTESHAQKRKIPKIVHMTSKSHCVSPDIYRRSIRHWYFEGYSYFMHDDDAVDRLFDRDWPEFPLLKESLSCIVSGAGKADLWRYLLLWEYGGIYTDLDNKPGPEFLNGTIITDDVDSFFEQEKGGFPSQYFMAASPHHPVMYFMVTSTIQRLLGQSSIVDQFVPFVTGPGATKEAVIKAFGMGRPSKGHYVGAYNRTMTVVGSRGEAKSGVYIKRDVVRKAKQYILMNMTHYNDKSKLVQKDHSCFKEIQTNSVKLRK